MLLTSSRITLEVHISSRSTLVSGFLFSLDLDHLHCCSGKDATTAFFGGVYDHSNAAHNLLAMKRVGILYGGHPHALDDKMVPPGSRLKVARYTELNGSAVYGSTTAWSEGDD